MKKKTVIITAFLACLLLVGAAFLLITKENSNGKNWNFNCTVSVTDGVANPEKDILNFEIEKDGDYVFDCAWEAGNPGLLTGLNLVNENGRTLFACTGESADIESKPLQLKAGNYQMEIYYIASGESLEQFFEVTGLESFEESEGKYAFAQKGEWEEEYSITLKTAGIISVGIVLLFSVILGILIVMILLAVTKNDESVKCKFDERQEIVRGRGFKYGFFSMMISGGVLIGLKLLGVSLLQEMEVAMTLSILIGIMVFASYCVWNDGYFSLNENRRRLMVVFAAIGVLNIFVGIVNIIHKTAIIDGKLTIHSINLFCSLLFIVIFSVLFFKNIKDGRDE